MIPLIVIGGSALLFIAVVLVAAAMVAGEPQSIEYPSGQERLP